MRWRDRQTDRHDETNSHFSQFWECARKFLSVYAYVLFNEAVISSGRTASIYVMIGEYCIGDDLEESHRGRIGPTLPVYTWWD